MSESNGRMNGHSQGGQGGHIRSEMKLAEIAIRDEYPIGPEIRQKIIDKAFGILIGSESERAQLSAAKVLIAADTLNAKREAIQIEERQTDIMEATAVLREAMKSPEVRKAMASISDHVCGPIKLVQETKHLNGDSKPDDATS